MFNSCSQRHSYHLVNPSPWPLFSAISALGLTAGLIFLMYLGESLVFYFGLFLCLLSVGSWWNDVTIEAMYEGKHSKKVQKGLAIGMLLFITSEVMFFFAFFWSYFYFSFNPSYALGGVWPPRFMVVPGCFHLPLTNTLLLLSSGVTLTLAHYSLVIGDKHTLILSLSLTVFLAIVFTYFQLVEYCDALFCISDSVYGSIFFLTTGFHGIHVFLGTCFLVVCLVRIYKDHFTTNHHVGFEFAAWYWHFVDVVWLFLYIVFYIWGSN